jgi:hypothetical protein
VRERIRQRSQIIVTFILLAEDDKISDPTILGQTQYE